MFVLQLTGVTAPRTYNVGQYVAVPPGPGLNYVPLLDDATVFDTVADAVACVERRNREWGQKQPASFAIVPVRQVQPRLERLI